MKFMNAAFIPVLVLTFVIFFLWKHKSEKQFLKWIKEHWFYLPSFEFKLGRLLYYSGMALLLFSLADLRGPEEKMETNIPDQKTIIIIDSSASMLVEDIRPNRYEKAILLARHFIKNAFGHKIAVVLFSDNQKRIVPFTDDLDLLDSRVAGLSGLNILHGGSNISQAVLESVQYFKENSGDKEKVVGNILVFTDAEEHDGLPIEVIKGDVSLAMVGVGSRNGGPIPKRSRNNAFRGYKTHNGKKVISKLDENFLKKFGEMVENYKYWVVSSYSIPTEELLSFFRGNYEEKMSKGNITTRPVYGHWIALLGSFLFSLSFLFKLKKNFVIPILVIMSFSPRAIKAQEEELKKINPETLEKLEKVRSGELSRKEKLNLALDFIKEGDFKTGGVLFKENIKPQDSISYKFNMSTGLLGERKLKEGISNLKNIYDSYNNNPQFEEAIRKNILFALKQEQKKRKQEQEDKKKQDQKEKEEKQKQQGQNGQDQQKGPKDDQNNEKDKKDQEGKDQKNKNEKKDNKQKKPKDLKEKEKQLKKKRKMVKIPAMIKQLMGQDRKLQEKYIDTSTQDKQQNKKSRDW